MQCANVWLRIVAVNFESFDQLKSCNVAISSKIGYQSRVKSQVLRPRRRSFKNSDTASHHSKSIVYICMNIRGVVCRYNNVKAQTAHEIYCLMLTLRNQKFRNFWSTQMTGFSLCSRTVILLQEQKLNHKTSIFSLLEVTCDVLPYHRMCCHVSKLFECLYCKRIIFIASPK
jgi:hypothetical protein